MRLPLRKYKNVSQSICTLIKKRLEIDSIPEERKEYIPEEFLQPSRISKDELLQLEKLVDHEYVAAVLNRDKPIVNLKALMVSEKERRRSFRSTWGEYEDKVRGIELAKAGFYFLNDEDRVKCAFCSGMIEHWEKGDEPMERHRRYFSFCKFVKGKSHENIPVDDLGLAVLYDKIWSKPDSGENDPRPAQSQRFLNMDPLTPEYKLRSKREESFRRGWPSQLSDTHFVGKLCDAGFFNSDPDEHTINSTECFFCGGTIEDWIGDEDPWAEHAKWFFKCPFLIKYMRHDAIDSVRATMSAQDIHESEHLSYGISTLPESDVTTEISTGQKKRKVRKLKSYEFVYKLKYTDEDIMLAYRANDWNEYDEPYDLLTHMYSIMDGDINPNANEDPQQQAQAAIDEPMLESELVNAIAKGDRLTEEEKEDLTERVTCRKCEEEKCRAAFKPFTCGCHVLCNYCCIVMVIPDCCLQCGTQLYMDRMTETIQI